MKKDWKKYAAPVLCAVGSAVLYAALTLGEGDQGPLGEDGSIQRGNYGKGAEEYEIFVEGLGEQELPVTVSVGARLYTEEEAAEAFSEIMEGMEERVRGENPSLMEVRSDLKLPSRIAEYGVRVQWYSSDSGLLDASGKLLAAVGEETQVVLSAELSADVLQEQPDGEVAKERYRQSYELPVSILPPDLSSGEQLIADFLDTLTAEDAAQQTAAVYRLPSEFEGRSLRYRMRKSGGYGFILLMGGLAAVLLLFRDRSAEAERQKKWDKQLLMDYSDVVSKLVVLTGAGLTVRNAWERIAGDYETAKQAGKQQTRAAYEEIVRTGGRMKNGLPEGEAYREFGKRCRLPPYLKLSSLLEQNRRTGMKDLRAILQVEMTDALEQRKNLARRLGEEAGTKLLAPLFLMLGVIMIMIMVPAMMSMG